MSYSKTFAKYIENVKYEDIPQHIIEFTKLCILDYYGSLLNGIHERPPKMMEEVAMILGGTEQATAASGYKTSITNAAFINGGASHVNELDDIHKSSIVHAATVIMPAAIAVAEWKNCTGKQLIEAIIVGYEVAFRIGETVTPAHYYYFHNTATCGTFGATAAVCKLLKLSEEQIVNAFGSAGTQAAGLWEFIEDGAMSKQLHPGNAGVNGIVSALLAQVGFTGASEILEGKRGFFEAMAKQYNVEKLTVHLGEQYKIIENSFKVHASCRHTHAAMDLALQLREKVDVREISSLYILTYDVANTITNNPNPTTIYAAKFSMQFCVALALQKGNGSLYSFNEETLNDAEIQALMKKMSIKVDDQLKQNYPEKWGTKLAVYMENGEAIFLETDYPKGDPENPLSVEDFISKFYSLCTFEPHKEHIAKSILQLEQLTTKELIATIHPSTSDTS